MATSRAIIPRPASAPDRLTPLADQPDYAALMADFQALERRHVQAEDREQIARARLAGRAVPRSIGDLAAALVSGGKVSSLPPGPELEAAREEQRILSDAMRAKREQLDALAGQLSYDACVRMAPAHNAALRDALAAAAALFDALERARVIRGQLQGAGYGLNDAAMPVHYFPVAAMVGSPDRHDTPAWYFRDWLRQKGVIR